MASRTRTERRSPGASARSRVTESPVTAFAARLRERRVASELTQAQVAERAELDVSSISQIERGLRDPSLTSLVARARGLGVTLASLVGDDDDATDDAPIVRTIAREIAELDEATQRDALEIVRRFRASVKRAAKTHGRD